LKVTATVCFTINQSNLRKDEDIMREITKVNFENEVLNSPTPVVIDFWAPWCGPCRMIAPFIEEIADEYADKIKVGKVNVDEEPELASKFRIVSIPTVILLKDGQVVSSSIGYKTKEQLVRELGI